MKNKILTLFLLGMFLLSFANVMALESLGTFKQGENVRISQVCNNANYITISSISNPDSSIAVNNTNMTFSGSGEFYYNFNSTLELGRYDIRGISDGCENTFATYFNVTPSGSSGSDNIVFAVFMIILIWGLTLIGFIYKEPIVTLIGGMAMVFLGVYLIQNGIIIYRDNLTLYFSYLTSFLGGAMALMAAISLIDEGYS